VVYGGVDLQKHVPVADKSELRRHVFADHADLQEPNTRILLTVARPVRAKGYVELLDAWKQVAPLAPNWRLVAVGGHDGDVDVPKLIAARELGDSARWLGYRSGLDLSRLMMASDTVFMRVTTLAKAPKLILRASAFATATTSTPTTRTIASSTSTG
jgi:glycosyltransferase involved in cell wall biosynthesis